jgi:hypothetical protein
MSAQSISFEISNRDRLADHPDAPACSLWYIQLRFGRHDWSPERMARFVQQMVAERGFPRPWPYLRGTAMIDRATVKSRWPRDQVDRWFTDFLPPSAQAAAALAMDANAAWLQLVGGRAA